MFKDLANIASLMKNAQQIQARMKELQDKLGEIHAEGHAGGGMVSVTASGHQQIVNCRIDKSLLKSGDQELLEGLIVSATNQALEKAKLAAAEQMQGLAGGIPGLGDLMGKFGG